MNLKETLYLSLAAVAVVIGIHRSMLEASVSEGVLYNYWLFMAAIIFLLLYRNEAQKRKVSSENSVGQAPEKPIKRLSRKK
jgi:hypothetical protein